MAITNNIGEIFLLKDGTARNPLNLNDYHPLSTTNGLLVHIEDGSPTNIVTVNYKPKNMSGFVTHEFPLFYRGMVEKNVYGATRTFAQYFTWVPTLLLAINKNKNNNMSVDLTVSQSTGQNLLGGFQTLVQINNEHPPTVDLQDTRAIAYVIENAVKGFYNVVWTGEMYVWQKITMPLVYYDIDVKQYNTFEIIVQKGNAPSSAIPITISDEIVRLLYQEIAQINYIITGLDSRVTTNENDIFDLKTNKVDVSHLTDENAHHPLFEERVKKISDPTDDPILQRVYGTDNLGNEKAFDVSPIIINGTIPIRDNEGYIEEYTLLDGKKVEKVTTQIPGLEDIDRLYIVDKYGNQVMAFGSVQSFDYAYVKRNAIGQIFELENHKNDNQAHKSLFDDKLNDFALLTEQTISLLNDFIIINRDGVAYKTTVAKLMDNAGFGDIFIVVAELPTEDIIPNKIYLLPKDESETGNLWDEYIYLNGEWELIGSVSVDLTNYYDKNEIDNLLIGKVDKANGYGLIADDDYGKFINAEKVVRENEFVTELEAGSEVALPFNLTTGKLMGLTLYINDVLMLDKGVPQLNYDWYDSEEGYFVLENQPLGFEWQFNYVDNKVVDIGAMGGELKFVVNIRDYVDASIFGAMEGDY